MPSARDRLAGILIAVLCLGAAPPALAQIVSSVLPLSRRVPVPSPATLLATITNAGETAALGCTIALDTGIPAALSTYRLEALGSPADQPVDIPAKQSQAFLLSFAPSAAFAPQEVRLRFACANTGPAPTLPGINTVVLGAVAAPAPDVVAIAGTATNDGIAVIDTVSGVTAFSVATVNVGGPGPCTAAVEPTNPALPIVSSICETDPATSACLPGQGPAASVSRPFAAGDTPTFAVFVARTGTPPQPFDPARDRLRVTFTDAAGQLCGATGVAVSIPPPASPEVSLTKLPPPAVPGAGLCAVHSTPVSGIDCGPTCSAVSAPFPAGTEIVLEAAPVAGSVFVEWGGDCQGPGECRIVTSEARAVRARCLRDTWSGGLGLVGRYTHPVTGCPYELTLAGTTTVVLSGGLAGTAFVIGTQTLVALVPAFLCPPEQAPVAVAIPIAIEGEQVGGSTIAGSTRMTFAGTFQGGVLSGALGLALLPPFSGAFGAPVFLSP